MERPASSTTDLRAAAATSGDAGAGTSSGRTFSSLRVRNFRLFIVGQLISTTGTWMQFTAGPWLVLQLSHSGTMLGLDAALQFVPMMLAGLWGGVIADRYDNRRTQIATQIAFAVLSVVLFTLVATGVVQLWMVFLISFLTGCVSAIDFPTRQSFYLEMVGPADLTNAMSLNTATFTATRIVGPAAAGLIIHAAGASAVGSTAPVFLINAFSYAAVVVALLLMRRSELHPRERVPRGKGQIREGIRYAWRTPDLRLPLLVMLGVFLFAYNFQILMPLLATRVFGGSSGAYGVMLAVVGIGSLAGALFMASRARHPNPLRLSVLAVALGLTLVGLSLTPSFALALLVLPVLGAAAIAFAITGNSTLQLTSAPAMRGRVMALYSVVFLGSTPIGGPLTGWFAQNVGTRQALAVGGAVAVAVGIAALVALQRHGPRRDARAPAPAPVSSEATTG
jgi:MFS family permease